MAYKITSLEEVCIAKSSNIAQKTLESIEGEFPIYGASGLIKNVDFYHQDIDYVAVVKDGAGIGRAMHLPSKSSVIGTVQYLIPNENIYSKYLYYVIRKLNLRKYNSGATIPHIYFKDYKKEKFKLYGLIDQTRIINILDKNEKIIELKKQQIKLYDQLIKSRFVEVFGKPFNNLNWKYKKLKEVSILITDGSNVNKKIYKSSSDVLFLRIKNVWRNEFRLEDSVYITDMENQLYLGSSLKQGDLLITKIGRYYTKDSSLGRVSVYLGQDDKANYSNNIMGVRVNSEMNSEFINILLNLNEFQQYIKLNSKGGTDKRALSKKIIGDYPIICPPKMLQDEYIGFVKHIDKLKFAVQKSLDETQILFDSLMQKYFDN